jgi:hypothetical protein
VIISINDLEKAVSKLKYGLLGYSMADKVDLQVTVSFIQADPGIGMLIDSLTFKAVAPIDEREPSKEISMTIEIYPSSEGQPPRSSKTEASPLLGKY